MVLNVLEFSRVLEKDRGGVNCTITDQKMKFPIKDFFSKCDQILNGNFIFCAVYDSETSSLKLWAFGPSVLRVHLVYIITGEKLLPSLAIGIEVLIVFHPGRKEIVTLK